MTPVIFHIDVNSAYLSWTATEQLKNGAEIDIRTIPAIIGGDQKSRHGIVLAKSIPAKRYGIHTGEPVANAFRKCSNLKSFPPDHKMYREKSRELMAFLAEFCPNIEQVSVDECYMDVTDVIEEGSGTDAPAIQIIRYHMEDEQTEARIIRNAVCDYDRTCRVESGGRILLVHAPLLDEISDLTPVRVYQFDSAEYVLLPQEEFPQESEEGESSQPSESGTSSEERPEQTLLYLFDGPITVSELEESYTEHTGVVRVTGTDGRIKTSGRVATGDLMEVLIDGQVSDRAVACIPGDITGRGKPSSADTQLLYEYLTTGCYLSDAEWKAGDLNCDGILSTGDLLLLKEMVWKQG